MALFLHYLYNFLLLLLVSAAEESYTAKRQCAFDMRCNCSYHLMTTRAFCSRQKITTVPNFTTDVIWIDLSYNAITDIVGSFPKRVEYIDLSSNKLKKLKGFPFEGLENLTYMNLQNNEIALRKSNYYNGIFKSLVSLRELNLKHNSPSSDGSQNYVIPDLKSLQTLKIDAEWNSTEFDIKFLKLRYLEKLDMSGITGFCRLLRIENTFFQNLRNLKYLDISACKIRDVDGGAFGVLTQLQFLDVSYNTELGFISVPNITLNLNKTAIRTLRVDRIHCLMGAGTTLRTDYLQNLRLTNIREVSLAFNRLEWIDDEVPSVLPKSVQKLSLAQNRVTTGPYVFRLNTMTGLREFNFSLQLHPPNMSEKLFENCHEKRDNFCPQKLQYKAKNFDLINDTQIKATLTPKTRNPKLQELFNFAGRSNFNGKIVVKNLKTKTANIQRHRSYRNKRNKHLNDLERYKGKWNFTFSLPPNLETVYWNSSRLLGSLPAFGLRAKCLKFIHLQDNVWYKWIGPVHGLQNVIYLDLSNNFCEHISSVFLIGFTGLKTLNISHNQLGPDIASDASGLIFQNQKLLEVLDLSANGILSLPMCIFKNLKFLKRLLLSHNRISVWNVAVKHMKNLQFLDLSKNRFSTITKAKMEEFQILFDTDSNFSVDFSQNMIMCTCQNLEFLSWMSTNKLKFKNRDQYVCSGLSVTSFNFRVIGHSIKTLKDKCRSFLTWYITGSVSASIIISISICITIYKYRWKIRYLRYMARQSRQGYNTVYTAPGYEYEYDAYISYCCESQTDRKFIRDILVQGLEKFGIKLFIMERNGSLGGDHADTIMENIQKSRNVLCIVSKCYLKSEWQNWEFYMARQEAIEKRKRLSFVYLILMPDVCNGKNLNKMKEHIRKNYFIEVPNDCHGLSVFLDDVKNVLKE